MVSIPWPFCWACSGHLFSSWRGPFVCPLGCGGRGISGTVCTRELLVLGWLSSPLTPGPPRSTTSPWIHEDSGKWPWCWDQWRDERNNIQLAPSSEKKKLNVKEHLDQCGHYKEFHCKVQLNLFFCLYKYMYYTRPGLKGHLSAKECPTPHQKKKRRKEAKKNNNNKNKKKTQWKYEKT